MIRRLCFTFHFLIHPYPWFTGLKYYPLEHFNPIGPTYIFQIHLRKFLRSRSLSLIPTSSQRRANSPILLTTYFLSTPSGSSVPIFGSATTPITTSLLLPLPLAILGKCLVKELPTHHPRGMVEVAVPSPERKITPS